MNDTLLAASVILTLALGVGCKRDSATAEKTATPAQTSPDNHSHDDGAHDNSAANDDHRDAGHGHPEEAELGSVTIGDFEVACAQGHGIVEAGKEGHLVVKLPYNDNGATTIRAWLGASDRTLSFVGKGTYAPSHDDYDIHAIAPDPLPDNTMWWIEVEKPDGTKGLGSIKAILD